MEQKTKNLIAFCQGILNKENGRELYDRYLDDINTVTPQDVFLVMNEQLKTGNTAKEMLSIVEKIINVFYKSLSSYEWQKPAEGTFLYYLIEENKVLVEKLDNFKEIIKDNNDELIRAKGLELIGDLDEYNDHMLKLENILFPYMEKKKERYNGLKIMWELHDRARKDLDGARAIVGDDNADKDSINKALGIIYFRLYGLVQKQELIMFPAASSMMTDAEFTAMHIQSFDFDFPFIKRPDKPTISLRELAENIDDKAVFHTDTGTMTHEQIEILINTLPVDITFINEFDKVAFFSKPKDRIFPRTSAVIGRDVRNCHPPKSVHVVEKILQSFRDGAKDNAVFWIQMNGGFYLIQYFALRDAQGKYKGTLEVSQDIAQIRQLDGEQRLLDWE